MTQLLTKGPSNSQTVDQASKHNTGAITTIVVNQLKKVDSSLYRGGETKTALMLDTRVLS